LDAIVPTRLSPAEGRKFAFTVGIAFFVLAGVTFWRGSETVTTLLAMLGGALLLAGVAVPGRLGPVYRAWMRAGLLISRVTNPIFMGLVYFIVFAPIGLGMRLLGRNPVVRDPVGDSFWVTRPAGRGRRSDLKRQF